MPALFKKPKSLSAPLPEDLDLEAFFTDVVHLRTMFHDMVSAEILPKRLLVIHGVGGVGKSTLLRMFRLYCKRQGVPVALISGNEVKSPIDVVHGFAQDLGQDGIELPDLARTLKRYREIQTKVEKEGTRISSAMAKAGAKTIVEIAVGSIPVVGPVVAAFGGVGTEAFVDWLRGFLSKPDLDLYLDPAAKLTKDLLNDFESAAKDRRLVLMLDTYEQMTGLDEWVRDLVKQLPNNVLTLIAGREAPGKAWDREWPGWMAHARIEVMEAMKEEHMRALVRNYYATISGGEVDAARVEEIVSFARGLPLVVTSAVGLWVRYGVQDFQAIKPQVVADLVDRLMEGIPDEMHPALNAAAALRWFNKEILRALLPTEQVEAAYHELQRFPFVHSRPEGYVLHNIVQECLDGYLKVNDPERYRELHRRAAEFFEAKLITATGEEAEQLARERLYQQVCVDEETGMRMYQEVAEELTRYRLVNRLRTLQNDVNTYPLKLENSCLWRGYYDARLMHLEAKLVNADQAYRAVSENPSAEPRLRAYAMCDRGYILCRREYLNQPGGEARALHDLEKSLSVSGQIDPKIALSWLCLSDLFTAKADWEEAFVHLHKAKKYFSKCKDHTQLLIVLLQEINIYGRQGDFRNVFNLCKEMQQEYSAMGRPAYLRSRTTLPWEWIWAGRYAEFEQNIRGALDTAESMQDQEWVTAKTRDLGLCLAMQNKCCEAIVAAENGLSLARSWGTSGENEVFGALALFGIVCFKCGDLHNAEEYLTQALSLAEKLHLHSHAAPWYLAIIYETRGQLTKSEQYYYVSKTGALQSGRNYFLCASFTGLARTKLAQGDYVAILPSLIEAEKLAQQYEYNDHLASLHLTQGHIAWDNSLPDWGTGFDAAIAQYQQALIYALRYNRFLLDEVLWGGGICTPLDPLLPLCKERGDEGRRMLEALREWWHTGINDVGMPRPDTISPIPEGIPLLEAERLARQREPGDGTPQRTVTEVLDAVCQ